MTLPNKPTTPGAGAPPNGSGWRVGKTMQPGQRGAVKLSRRYGESLVCVRYRESPDGSERITTVELEVERARVQPRPRITVAFKILAWEKEMQRVAKSKGATYDPRTRMWHLPRHEVIAMGLERRIASSKADAS